MSRMVGTGAEQVPLNSMLGRMAFVDSAGVRTARASATFTPSNPYTAVATFNATWLTSGVTAFAIFDPADTARADDILLEQLSIGMLTVDADGVATVKVYAPSSAQGTFSILLVEVNLL